MILKASTRAHTGTVSAKQARREGKLPATIYGKGFEAISVLVDEAEARHIVRTMGRNAVMDIDIDGERRQKAMIQYISRNPMTNKVLNLEFRVIRAGDRVRVNVPIVITGGESIIGADILHTLQELHVEAPADNIPAEIEHDVTGMHMGDVLTVKDLTVPAGVTVLADEDEPVVSIAAPTVFKELETEAVEEGDVPTVAEEKTDED